MYIAWDFARADRSQLGHCRTIVQRRLPGYGHRNWIVVADAAFSAYAQASIETIVVNQNLTSILIYVVQAFSSSKHVRDTAFLD
jgi:hypothetical protein